MEGVVTEAGTKLRQVDNFGDMRMPQGTDWDSDWEPLRPVSGDESSESRVENAKPLRNTMSGRSNQEEGRSFVATDPALVTPREREETPSAAKTQDASWERDWGRPPAREGHTTSLPEEPHGISTPSRKPPAAADLEQAARFVLREGELLWAKVDPNEARLPSGLRLTLVNRIDHEGWWPVRVVDAAALKAEAVEPQGTALQSLAVEPPETFAAENDVVAHPRQLAWTVQVGAGRFYIQRYAAIAIAVGAFILGLLIG